MVLDGELKEGESVEGEQCQVEDCQEVEDDVDDRDLAGLAAHKVAGAEAVVPQEATDHVEEHRGEADEEVAGGQVQ